MKKLLLLVIVASVAGWWYFIGGRKLNEAQVRDFYQQYEHATLSRNADSLCAMLADNFTSTAQVALGPQQQRSNDSASKSQTCESWHKLFESWARLGEKLGGELQLDSTYQIHSIKLAPDGKSANVDVSNSLDVAGTIMNIRSHTQDVLIRRNGRVLMMRSDGDAAVTSGG